MERNLAKHDKAFTSIRFEISEYIDLYRAVTQDAWLPGLFRFSLDRSDIIAYKDGYHGGNANEPVFGAGFSVFCRLGVRLGVGTDFSALLF